MKQYDAIILGFGKGGKTMAGFLAKQGKKVALIEKSQQMYGGTCINVGCIPSKTLAVRSGNINYSDAFTYKHNLVSKLRDKNYHKLADLDNVDVYDAHGRFVSDHVISLDNKEEIQGDLIFINTGSTSFVPPIEGTESELVYTSADLLGESELPQKLAIVGGGYIGLEFASMYARYGSEVTVFVAQDKLIEREDRDVANTIQEILEAAGVTFVFGASVSAIKESDGQATVVFNGQKSQAFDKVLLATGRKANTDDLGLENTSVKTDARGNIVVDEHLETDALGVFALGDVKGGLQFTYISLDDFRIVRDYLFGNKERTIHNRSNIAYSVFIAPTFSRVGLSETQAQAQGYNYKAVSMPVAAVPRAHVDGAPAGIMKAVVDMDTQKILGCALVAQKSEEVINFVALAMDMGLSYKDVANHIFTHPSMSESFNDLFGLV